MIRSPVIVIGCPRSGTTLLFNILSEAPALWSIGYESKAIIERYHAPAVKGWDSGALDADDLTAESRAFMLHEFQRQAAPGTFWRRVNRFRSGLRDNSFYRSIRRRGRSTAAGSSVSSALPQAGLDTIRRAVALRNRVAPPSGDICLVEKTPENCLRLPFFLALFPDARIIYLTRDGRSNVSSLMEGWLEPHTFPGYDVPAMLSIPGYSRPRWAFSLIPGWRDLTKSPLEEVCAWQWIRCNEAVLEHREQTAGRVPYLTLRYEDLIADPRSALQDVATFLAVDFTANFGRYADKLPEINIVSAPDAQKWRRKHGVEIERLQPLIEPTMARLGYGT